MKCKKCKNENPDGSFYCNRCGAKLFRDDEISVPKPRRRKDGSYAGQVYRNGRRMTIEGRTLAEYRQNARDFKLSDAVEEDALSDPLEEKPLIFGDMLYNYITAREDKLSPVTVKNLMSIYRTRFTDALDMDIRLIDWQKLIDHEATLVSPSSLTSIWHMVKPMFAYYGVEAPKVKLPKATAKEQDCLNPDQILKLLEGIRGSECEAAIILALHSLRLSELCALNVEDIHDGLIHVNKSLVPTEQGQIIKDGNKTDASTRNIPVMIDRLYEILPESGRVVKQSRDCITHHINRICKELGLPVCSCHDLRRSFCSLCYEKGIREEYLMAYGGWTDYATVHKYYIKLSEQSKLKNAEILRDYFNITSEPGKPSK